MVVWLARLCGNEPQVEKKGGAAGAGWLVKTGVALIVLGVVVSIGLYIAVRGYMHSDGFRLFLSEKVSQAAKVDGEFTPFRWDGLAASTSAFEATGPGLVKAIRLDELRTEIGVGGLSRGVWEIRGSRVQRVEVSLDATAEGRAEAPPVEIVSPPVETRSEKKPGWLPTEVELQGLDVGEVVVRAVLNQGLAVAEGMRVRVEPAGGQQAYRAEVADGTIRLPFDLVPLLRLERAKLRYQDRLVFLNSIKARAWENGLLEASGEWDAAAKRYSLEGDVSGVKCEEVFSEDWSKRFTGKLGSDFTLDNLSGEMVARGRLACATARSRRCRCSTRSRPMRTPAVSGCFHSARRTRTGAGRRAKSGSRIWCSRARDWSGWRAHSSIRGEALDGNFRLGLAPGTLATIPGAETDVFLPGERGLVWAPLRITGTLDDPKEDLTDRLIDAAGHADVRHDPGNGREGDQVHPRGARGFAEQGDGEGRENHR